MAASLKVAVVGSGISGLAVAHTLRDQAEITLFEAGAYFGGHTHTVDVTLPTPQGPRTHGVDTGFLVFNERTYPNLINLFAELGIATAKSDMSFSVQVPGALDGGKGLEWSGTSLSTVFAQRRNLASGRFLRMLADLLRFNALATRLAARLGADDGSDEALARPLGDFLVRHRFSDEFRDWYLLPMVGCIWSCPTDQMLQFPVATMLRFCHNHGLLQISNRPQWWTVTGGARRYVDAITAGIADKRLETPVRLVEREPDGVRVYSEHRGRVQSERFDRLVIATHADQALGMLRDASPQEREVLGAFRYHPNRAVLHTDTRMLPTRRPAWAAWNYERAADRPRESTQVCLHYLINQLQPLPFEQPVIVSLNPVREIARTRIMGEFDYAHPVFDAAALRAQRAMPSLQGRHHTWYCGAWMGYGFHEDGLKAGLGVARELLHQSQHLREAA